MALTKQTIVDKIEVQQMGQIQVRQRIQILENGVEISSSFHRYVLEPDFAGDIATHDPKVQAIAKAIWTTAVKADWIAFKASQAKP